MQFFHPFENFDVITDSSHLVSTVEKNLLSHLAGTCVSFRVLKSANFSNIGLKNEQQCPKSYILHITILNETVVD